MKDRTKTVGVMGSGKEEWQPYSTQVGALIAKLGFNLLTGGGRGTMTAVTKAFVETSPRRGISIGVIPTIKNEQNVFEPKPGYPNPYVELPILGPLGTYDGLDPEQLSRNHTNILTSDCIVALPGSKGTWNEISLAQRFQKTLFLFGPTEEFAQGNLSSSEDLSELESYLLETLT